LLYSSPRYWENFEIMKKVLIYSRTGCHLCEIAIDQINSVRNEKNFQVEIKLIDGSHELEEKYGEQVPVIFIDEKIHDYWRVDLKRFTKAINA
jgi:glutaredoxin